MLVKFGLQKLQGTAPHSTIGEDARTNTSGIPPRGAAKIVRTTTHRVSVGVLRIRPSSR